MRPKFNPEIISLLELIRGELSQGQDLYLVGGAVRDALLNRKINDLDFAMEGDPTSLAKKLAKRLNVGFFVLDDERRTARVLYRRPGGDLSPLDFVQFTGGGLAVDLLNRDFTINAMAVALRDLEGIIDPLRGREDLAAGLLRPCLDHALLDDPVRVLRGIRLVLQFDLEFVEVLKTQMLGAARRLPMTSYERQRDEFFKILEGPDPAEGMRHCRAFGVFTTLIPPLTEQEEIPVSPPHTLPLFDHTITTVEIFGNLLDQIQSGHSKKQDLPWWMSYAVKELSPFSREAAAYFSEEITPGRSKRGLALLGTLLHDIGKPLTMKMGEDDRLHYYGHARVGADLVWDAARRLQLSNACRL
ncbi:MAG: HD domain-containing protein [Brevefilum sp.]